MKFTVLGARGFIGSHLVRYLESQGADLFVPATPDEAFGRPLGHCIYCIGVTADFRQRPFDTAEAHVGVLTRVLRQADFDSLLYLSSTRVYRGIATTREDATFRINPADPEDLYDITKLAGEALCLCGGRPAARVARLSNVAGPKMGPDTFLGQIMAEARDRGVVELQSTLDSEKDYVWIDDVVKLLPAIAAAGRERVYNIAAGRNLSNAAIAHCLQEATGCKIHVAPSARRGVFPVIDIKRVSAEFFAPATDVLAEIARHLK